MCVLGYDRADAEAVSRLIDPEAKLEAPFRWPVLDRGLGPGSPQDDEFTI